MINKLTDAKLRAIKTVIGEEQRHADGGGLSLVVTKSGSKTWVQAYRFGGSGVRTLSFGLYPDIPLSVAREHRSLVKQAILAGTDPRTIKLSREQEAADASARSFRAVAEQWFTAYTALRTTSQSTIVREKRIIKRFADAFGDRDVATLKNRDFMAVISTYNNEGSFEMRDRSFSTATRIMTFAGTRGLIDANPVLPIDHAAAAFAQPEREARAAIVEAAPFGELLRKIDTFASPSRHVMVPALRFLALTFVRPHHVAEARWAHIDLDAATWTIPGEEGKMRKDTPHIVPLSRQAVALLRQMQALSGSSQWVFPSRDEEAGHICTPSLRRALNTLGYQGIASAHGFRSSASTMLGEEQIGGVKRFADTIIDLQMDHEVKTTDSRSKVAFIYDRSQRHNDPRLAERAAMMQHWADMIDRMRDGAQVISITAVA